MSKKQLEKGQQMLRLFFNSSISTASTTTTKPTTKLATEKLSTNESSTSLKPNICEEEQPPGDLGTDKPSQPVIDFPKTMCDELMTIEEAFKKNGTNNSHG